MSWLLLFQGCAFLVVRITSPHADFQLPQLQRCASPAGQRLSSVLTSSCLHCDAALEERMRADLRSVVAPNIDQSKIVGTGFHSEVTTSSSKVKIGRLPHQKGVEELLFGLTSPKHQLCAPRSNSECNPSSQNDLSKAAMPGQTLCILGCGKYHTHLQHNSY